MGKTDEYRYSFRVYGGHTNFLQLKVGILPGSHQVFLWGILTPLLLLIFYRVCHKPQGLYLWEWRHPILVRTYNKSWYLAVCSGSAPDTPRPLSRASTGPILNMIRRAPSVFNNLFSGLYAEVCGMGCIPMHTNQTSLNNNIIIWF